MEKAAIEEQQINEILFFGYNKTVLITHKREITTQCHNEVLDIVNNLLLYHTLICLVRIFNVHKVEQIFVLERA